MKFETEAEMLHRLEYSDLDYFAEEWCVPKMRTMEAVEDIKKLVREFASLCKTNPFYAECYASDLIESKRKILQYLIKNNSLLNPESI